MTRTLLTMLLGLLVGVGTYKAYFHFRQPANINTLDGQLAWMKTELNVSDSQLEHIRELHQASVPRLRALSRQVAQLQREFAAFEKTRRTDGQVDFIEFARFLETRRTINQECIDSTRKLVLASADVMDTKQRQRYLGVISEVIPIKGLATQ